MKYTSRLKIIAEKKSLLNRITYDFVNETAKQVFKENKLDSNWCTKVYDCDKDDKVYFDIKIDKKTLNMRCHYKPRLNGTYKDSIYYMKAPPLIIKPEGLQKNSNGNSILVLSSTKKNENLATILHEKTKGANEYIASTSDAVGILRNGVKVYDKNNFSWGVLDSKKTPIVSIDRIMKITEFKVYPVRPSGYQFHGNQWTNTRNVKNVADKISTKVGAAGDIADGLEMYTLMKNGEAKKLAEKNGEFIGTKIGDAGAAKMVGKCTKSLFTAKSPSGVALKGIVCAGSGFAIHTLGKNVGKMSGKTDIYTEVMVGLIEADRIITEEEDKAMEEYYQKYPEERHWNKGSD